MQIYENTISEKEIKKLNNHILGNLKMNLKNLLKIMKMNFKNVKIKIWSYRKRIKNLKIYLLF
jgi:hypothetical protein